jgi:DNA-binding GntR family transcriptional regulator
LLANILRALGAEIAFEAAFVSSFGIMVRRNLHEQARQGIERLIKERALTPGSKLPSESNLASELYVSRGTIRNALNLLEQEGKIERTPGRWTIVGHPHLE